MARPIEPTPPITGNNAVAVLRELEGGASPLVIKGWCPNLKPLVSSLVGATVAPCGHGNPDRARGEAEASPYQSNAQRERPHSGRDGERAPSTSSASTTPRKLESACRCDGNGQAHAGTDGIGAGQAIGGSGSACRTYRWRTDRGHLGRKMAARGRVPDVRSHLVLLTVGVPGSVAFGNGQSDSSAMTLRSLAHIFKRPSSSAARLNAGFAPENMYYARV